MTFSELSLPCVSGYCGSGWSPEVEKRQVGSDLGEKDLRRKRVKTGNLCEIYPEKLGTGLPAVRAAHSSMVSYAGSFLCVGGRSWRSHLLGSLAMHFTSKSTSSTKRWKWRYAVDYAVMADAFAEKILR
jgi:hypothetical protein